LCEKGNFIADDGIKAISEALKVNTSLTSLDLSRSKITDVGAESLATGMFLMKSITVFIGLKENNHLVTLKLEGNKLTSAGFDKLGSILSESATLKKIKGINLTSCSFESKPKGSKSAGPRQEIEGMKFDNVTDIQQT
jgi:hypothetical protein